MDDPHNGIAAKARLMVGGPTEIPPDVIAAATRPVIDERTAEFAEIFQRVAGNLRTVLCTDNDILLFTSSMTGALEGCLQNLFSPGDRVLVASNGYFGERWAHMCQVFGLDVVQLTHDWGEPLDNRRVAEAVARDESIVAALCVHCETSTGAANDVAGFAAAAGRAVTVIDAASSAGACPLHVDGWGLDVVVTGSQKALMTPPGLSIVSVSSRAWELAKRSRMPRYYFDWQRARAAYTEAGRTPWTPAVSLVMQLDQALCRLVGEGLERVLARHATLGRMARAGCEAMGLRPVAAGPPNAAMTAVWLPPEVSARKLVIDLAQLHGIQLATGTEPLADRVVRIGHCGYTDGYDVIAALAGLESLLYQQGAVPALGAAVRAAQHAAAGMEERDDD